MMKERKTPKLLIVGHGRHGKDTLAEILRDTFELSFESSSYYVAQQCIWPTWGWSRYTTFEEMFEDRVNYRETWSNLIKAYNTPDLARTAREMIQVLGKDMYVGMRDVEEFNAAKAAKIFDCVVWVDASDRLPPEDNPKFTITKEMADIIIDNNGDLEDLENNAATLVHLLRMKGFQWGSFEEAPPVIEAPASTDETIDMNIIPEDAVRVLDHGYVVLMNVNGTDDDIAEAARLSYGRGTKKVSDNSGLIRYLYTNAHTSPFEMVSMKFMMRLPIFVMRQWVRHRTAHLNEYSGRYSVMPRLFYIPDVERICYQHTVNKQGSGEPLPEGTAVGIQAAMLRISNACFDEYENILEQKVSRETARIILPLNTYTEIVWQMDLNNMLKFLWLRDDHHAQWEIQMFAKVIAKMVKTHFPNTYAAYMRRREAVTLTKDQIRALLTNDWENLPKSEHAQLEDLLSGLDY